MASGQHTGQCISITVGCSTDSAASENLKREPKSPTDTGGFFPLTAMGHSLTAKFAVTSQKLTHYFCQQTCSKYFPYAKPQGQMQVLGSGTGDTWGFREDESLACDQ